MQVMHTHMGDLQRVFIPIQAKDDYPTISYVPMLQKIMPSVLPQAYLSAQIHIPLGISDECESCFYTVPRQCVFPRMISKHKVQSMWVIAHKTK